LPSTSQASGEKLAIDLREIFRELLGSRDIWRRKATWTNVRRGIQRPAAARANWRPIALDLQAIPRRATQWIDFGTSHALFMCLFCFLLTARNIGIRSTDLTLTSPSRFASASTRDWKTCAAPLPEPGHP
jgi:hypothetical protein